MKVPALSCRQWWRRETGKANRKSKVEKYICEILDGLRPKAQGSYKDQLNFVEDRAGHDKRYALDISKVRTLGWKPRYNFKGALELTVNWYTQNKAWWKRLIKCRKDIKY